MTKGNKDGLHGVTRLWWLVWKRHVFVYRKRWRTYILPPMIEPFLMILALGVGLGYFIKEIEGIPYLLFVSAGLLASDALMRATFECTYGTLWRLKYQNTFEGMVCTPISPSDVAFAEVMWGATRASINTLVILVVLVALGVFSGPALLLVPFIVFLGALGFSSLAVIVTAKVPDMEYFNFYFAAFVFPTLFLAGTYFPLSRLPDIAQTVLWAIPYTSLVDSVRSIVIGREDPWLLAKLGYVLTSTAFLAHMAVRLLARRIVS